MEKRTAGLLGAVAGLATMGVAHAAVPAAPNAAEALQAHSYADLLTPVQNASALLKAQDAQPMQQSMPDPDMLLAQYYGPPGEYGPPRYHHHHHHQAYHHHHHANYARNYHHHHHHHHQQGTFVGIPGVGGVVVGNSNR